MTLASPVFSTLAPLSDISRSHLPLPRPSGYLNTAQKLVDALREAISTDLSDAEEREVRCCRVPATCGGQGLAEGWSK